MPGSRPDASFWRHLTILYLSLCLTQTISGQDLLLPDFYIPRPETASIPQKRSDLRPSDEWKNPGIRYRRLYPLSIPQSAPLRLPIAEPRLETQVDPGIPESISPTLVPQGTAMWAISIHSDSREGMGLEASAGWNPRSGVSLGSFVPFYPESQRPWSVWTRLETEGDVQSHIGMAIRQSEVMPVSPLAWFDGKWRPVDSRSWEGDSRITLFYDDGLSVFSALNVGYTIALNEHWRFGTDIEGGLWLSENLIGGGGLLGFQGSWTSSRKRLRLGFGAKGGYDTDGDVVVLPMLDIAYGPAPGWTLYSRSNLGFGSEQNLGPHLRDNRITQWSIESTVRSLYALGFLFSHDQGSEISMETRIRWGHMPVSDGLGSLQDHEDLRIGGSLDMQYPLPNTVISIVGMLEVSVFGYPLMWNFAMAGTTPHYSVSLGFGSENMVLGPGIPGIRGTRPIVEMGASIEIGWGLLVGGSVYSDFGFDIPGFTVSLDWEH